MANYYQRYELSRSLNGNKIVYIARNAAGNVVFRESSEENLKKAIDQHEDEKRRAEEEKEKLLAHKEETRSKKKKLLKNTLQEEIQERKLVLSETEGEALATTEETLPGESDQEVEPKKSSFWDRLK